MSAKREDISDSRHLLDLFFPIPPSHYVPTTTFLVDAFRYPRFDRACRHFFLTHFHSDHYSGLDHRFKRGVIYCSVETANLCEMRLGVNPLNLRRLEFEREYEVGRVKVRLIDANHCPGSACFLFTLEDGRHVLHSGDLRYYESMTLSSSLRDVAIWRLYLDTTYCNPRYTFPEQSVPIDFVAKSVLDELEHERKTVVLVGTYQIGKERILKGIADHCHCKIFVDRQKYRILSQLNLPYFDIFTTDLKSTAVHASAMWSMNLSKLNELLEDHYRALGYQRIVGIKPTGWTFSFRNHHGSFQDKGFCRLYQIPYSEHSAFQELQRMVDSLRPLEIIPTVNCTTFRRIQTMRQHFAQTVPLMNPADCPFQPYFTRLQSEKRRQQRIQPITSFLLPSRVEKRSDQEPFSRTSSSLVKSEHPSLFLDSCRTEFPPRDSETGIEDDFEHFRSDSFSTVVPAEEVDDDAFHCCRSEIKKEDDEEEEWEWFLASLTQVATCSSEGGCSSVPEGDCSSSVISSSPRKVSCVKQELDPAFDISAVDVEEQRRILDQIREESMGDHSSSRVERKRFLPTSGSHIPPLSKRRKENSQQPLSQTKLSCFLVTSQSPNDSSCTSQL